MSVIDKCAEHASGKLKGKPKPKGKTCTQIIAEGNCFKEKCRLFPKVLRMLPKLKNMYELQAKGVILHTLWRFDEKPEEQRLRAQKKAEEWLTVLYPKIEQNLGRSHGC